MDIQAPKGFKLDPASGLYYLETIEKDAYGNDVRSVIWLNLQTGEHRKEVTPLNPVYAQPQKPVNVSSPASAPTPQKKSKVGMILGIVFGSLFLVIVAVGVAVFLLFRGCVNSCTGALFNPYGGSVSHGGGGGGPINSHIDELLPGVDELPGLPEIDWDDLPEYDYPDEYEEPENTEPEEYEPDDYYEQGSGDVEERLKLSSDNGGYSISDPVPGTFRPSGNKSPNGWGIGYCFGFYYVTAQTDDEYGAYGDDYISYIRLDNDGTYEMYCSAGGDSWWWDGEFTMTDKSYEMEEIYVYLYDAFDGAGNSRTAVFIVDEGGGYFITPNFGYMGENYGTDEEPFYFFSYEE